MQQKKTMANIRKPMELHKLRKERRNRSVMYGGPVSVFEYGLSALCGVGAVVDAFVENAGGKLYVAVVVAVGVGDDALQFCNRER